MLNIVCALHCEAKPLIDRLRLKRDGESIIFPLYIADEVNLIVSGVGKLASAAATGYLISRCEKQFAAWLNIGIGGHKSKTEGEIFLAESILDLASKKIYYPGISVLPKLSTLPIHTIESVEEDYPERAIVDMEGSGFFSIASRQAPVELVHCLKVISDNQHLPKHLITKESVTLWISNHLETIIEMIKKLETLRSSYQKEIVPKEVLHFFLKQWRFTKTEQVYLQELLEKLFAVKKDKMFDKRVYSQKSVKEVLKQLQCQINQEPLIF